MTYGMNYYLPIVVINREQHTIVSNAQAIAFLTLQFLDAWKSRLVFKQKKALANSIPDTIW
jgi:hypothetical protein